jgi:hypothetical protein
LQHLLREAESTFGATTLHAFRRLALDGASAEAVAAETGLTVAAVYLAKSRVLRRLRADAAELLGDDAPRRPGLAAVGQLDPVIHVVGSLPDD